MKTALLILRLGLGLTFAWVGVLILLHPDVWQSFMQPWASALVPPSLALSSMQATGVLDIVIGFFLIINVWTWLAALIGVIHLVIVLVVTGITDVTVRDIGLLLSTVSLFIMTLPQSLAAKWGFR